MQNGCTTTTTKPPTLKTAQIKTKLKSNKSGKTVVGFFKSIFVGNKTKQKETNINIPKKSHK